MKVTIFFILLNLIIIKYTLYIELLIINNFVLYHIFIILHIYILC